MALTVALTLGAASTSEAQHEERLRDEEAHRLFEAARAARARGDNEAALSYFQRSYELSGRPELLFNIGLTADELHRTELAIESYEAFLDARPDGENRAWVEGRLRTLRSATPGNHEETTREPGAPDGTDGDADADDAGDEAVAPSAPGPALAGPVTLLASGGAVLIASAVTGGLALSRVNTLASRCPMNVCPDEPELRSQRSEAETLSIVTDVLWPVGAVALGAGVAWLIVALTRRPSGRAALRGGCDGLGCRVGLAGVFP